MARNYEAITTKLSDDETILLECCCSDPVRIIGRELEQYNTGSKVLYCSACADNLLETTELVKTDNHYDFYVITCHNGRKLYNIVPRGSNPPSGGYGRRSWIESVKGVIFGETETTLASMG